MLLFGQNCGSEWAQKNANVSNRLDFGIFPRNISNCFGRRMQVPKYYKFRVPVKITLVAVKHECQGLPNFY